MICGECVEHCRGEIWCAVITSNGVGCKASVASSIVHYIADLCPLLD